jgi:hypothetical protein
MHQKLEKKQRVRTPTQAVVLKKYKPPIMNRPKHFYE